MKRILLTILAFGAFACYAFAQGCPNPVTFCSGAHPGSSVTGQCGNEECFGIVESKIDGSGIRIVAGDDGDFPRRWFAWHKGTMTPAGTFKCGLEEKQQRTFVKIPPTVNTPTTIVKHNRRCRADLDINGQLYHEHFVSNPDTKCVGWVECKEPGK
jgi:hypothetical protein